MAIAEVTMASSMPSGISAPSLSRTASVNMWWPTLRISIRLRPGSTSAPPSGAVNWRSAESLRSSDLPPLLKVADRLPSISPSQLRYTSTLSSASTAATLSSQSMIVLMADSSTTSATPAGSPEPIGCDRSITTSMCKPLRFNTIALGAEASPE